MLESKENRVKIEGILSEINLKPITFVKNGRDMNAISGSITVRVRQKLAKNDAEASVLEIPVQMFAAELKNDGTPNPAFDNIKTIMNDYVSIAAAGEESADRIRITNGQIRMNEYYGQSGNLVSFPRINASFVSKIRKEDMKSEATFSVVFAVANADYEMDSNGEPTDRFCIQGILPQWGGSVDVVKFYCSNKNVIDAVSQYWNQGDTVRASGRLNFTSTTQTVMREVDFGDPIEETRTISVSDLLITGGSSTPLEDEAAFDAGEIQEALKKRKAHLMEMKDKKSNAPAKKAAPAAKPRFDDLGF